MVQCLDLFKCVSNHEALVEDYVEMVGNQVVWGLLYKRNPYCITIHHKNKKRTVLNQSWRRKVCNIFNLETRRRYQSFNLQCILY